MSELKNGIEQHQLTAEDRRKGGLQSAENKRKKKNLREALEMLFEKEIKTNNGETISGIEALATTMFKKAVQDGDVQAAVFCRDSSGQKPIERVMVAEVEQSVIDEIEEMMNEESER